MCWNVSHLVRVLFASGSFHQKDKANLHTLSKLYMLNEWKSPLKDDNYVWSNNNVCIN